LYLLGTNLRRQFALSAGYIDDNYNAKRKLVLATDSSRKHGR
jgi:hypothetical protein